MSSEDGPSGLMPITKETMEGTKRVNLNFLIQGAMWNCGSYAKSYADYVHCVRHLEVLVTGSTMDDTERENYKKEVEEKEVELAKKFSGGELYFELALWRFNRLSQVIAKGKPDESPDELE